MNPSTILYLIGSFSIFLGERMFEGSDPVRWTLDGLGVVVALSALASRAGSLSRHPSATRLALFFYAISMSSIVFYVLQQKDTVAAFGFAEDTTKQVRTALQVLIPLAWFVGALPAFGLNRTLAASPKSVHPLRVSAAWEGGLGVGLGVAMLFPLNWLAHEHNERFDFGFFKTTKVGEATHKAVDALNEPVRAVLFFPPSSEVLSEVRPYFDDLEGPNLSVEIIDHAMDPEQAKVWKIKDNGNVAIVMGEKVETIKLSDKLDTAKKDLRKLDQKVQAAILKLSREKRTVYFTVGHDEAYWKNAAGEDSNLDSFKKVLEGLNFKVKELGMDDGLGSAVPDDAAIVFVTGPKKPFFAEEVAALKNFRDAGGSLFLMLEPTDEPDAPLAELAGVSFDWTPVMSDKAFLRVTGGPGDHAFIGTNKFTSHESVTTLSKHSTEAVLITPTAGSIAELDNHPGKVTVTVKGMPEWFHDRNGNFEFDTSDEKRGGVELAAIASGPAASEGTDGTGKSEWRAAVIGDATLASNMFIRNPANAAYLVDTIGWLTSDPAVGGETENEEDVKIQHTKEGEALWFYGTSAMVPALVFVAGAWRVARRRKQGAA